MQEFEELKNYLAREVMQEVVAVMKKEKISKQAAYYAFFHFLPKDTSSFTEKEIAVIKRDMGYKQMAALTGLSSSTATTGGLPYVT